MAELTDEQKVMRNATGQYIGDQVKLLRYLLAGGLPDGGADGQLLRKKGSEDYSLEWYTPNYAPNDSPALAGTPTAPTAASGTNSTQLATTAFVQQEKHLGITGASVGDLIRVGAVDANGKPTSWEHVPLYPSNENLLDNWYFVGGGSQLGDGVFPINQRGQTSYPGAVFGVDRWHVTSGSSSQVTIDTDGVIYKNTANTNRFSQHAPISIAGKTVTLSALCTVIDGARYAVTIQTNAGNSTTTFTTDELTSVTFTVPSTATEINAQIRLEDAGASVKIHAMKLELGDFQTLAHQENGDWVLNEIPDFGEELRKCLRFTKRIAMTLPAMYVNGSSNTIDLIYADGIQMSSEIKSVTLILAPTNVYIGTAVSSITNVRYKEIIRQPTNYVGSMTIRFDFDGTVNWRGLASVNNIGILIEC